MTPTEQLLFQIKEARLPAPATNPQGSTEYRFAAEVVGTHKGVRKRLKERGLQDWRFDMAWPEYMVALEIEGGGWVGGRHTRGKGFYGDMRKYHAAVCLRWQVYRCDVEMVRSGMAIEALRVLLGGAK